MNSLRKYVRSLLLEVLAIPVDTLERKLKEKMEDHPLKKSGQIEYVSVYSRSHNSMDIKFVLRKEPAEEIDYGDTPAFFMQMMPTREERKRHREESPIHIQWIKDTHKKIVKELSEWANKRGWNLVASQPNPLPGAFPPRIEYTLLFDQLPNIKSTGLFSIAGEMQDHLIYHMTPSKNVSGIMEKGIKPKKKSRDGSMFGSGRSYYVAIPKKYSEEKIKSFFEKRAKDPTFSGATGKQSVLVIDPAKLGKNTKFYKDAEFGLGTGFIRGLNARGHAVWTPTFINSDSVIKVINL